MTSLPPDLPGPVDDGAVDGLEGRPLPPVHLDAATGEPLDLASLAATGTLVAYVYPGTGVPGQEPPPGWTETPGAFGCTAESCAFRDHATELAAAGARVVGITAQPLEEQREFAARERIPYPLLNDAGLALADRLGLPLFEVAGLRRYQRLTLIAREGRIVKVFHPVFPPDEHPAEVLAWLRAHPA